MVWEAVFMLLVLKIPVVYLCLVVWFAIRAEPELPGEPGAHLPAEVPPSPSVPPRHPARARAHRRPAARGLRRPARVRSAAVRSEAGR
jgi:hypothetical protein